MKIRIYNGIILSLLIWLPLFSQENTPSDESGYRIEQPGTITFTVGVKIKGKVEKPQVMIFLPKEKTQHQELEFKHSFKNDIIAPLPFTPLAE